MGYKLFQRRGRQDAPESEFAATVAILPPDDDARAPLGRADTPAAADSLPPDSLPPDSLPPDSVPPDSLPPDSQPPDSIPPEALAQDSQPPQALRPGAAEPPDTGRTLADLRAHGASPEEPPPLSDSATAALPTTGTIGRYALKQPLGHGGLGQVHEAWDPLLSRAVAIKTLHFETDGPTRASLDRMFLNEARAIASLSHPNIVTVHDAGLSPQGVYIAMERLQGRDLRRKLAEGWHPSPGQAAQLVRRVAEALAYAHARGIVHCDIKPANIFLSHTDRPKVLDFGIARVAHGRALPALEGWVAGSPHYLAPEQLLNEEIDARTDVYALGVVFYELLAGRKAFTGDSVEQITTAVLTNHPAPAHELRHGVSPTLSRIAARAMARSPADRYPSASGMAADIRRWVDKHAKTASRPARRAAESATAESERAAAAALAAQVARKRRLLVGSAIGGLTVLVLGSVIGLTMRTREGPNPAPTRPAAAAVLMASDVPAGLPADAAASAPGAAASDAIAATPAVAETGLAAPPSTPVATPSATVPAAPAAGTRTAAAPRPARPATGGRDNKPAAAATGSVQLAISPWGQVEVNGQSMGTTPPLTQLTLPEGMHQITVRNADFPPYSTSVKVQADRPLTLRHRFNQ